MPVVYRTVRILCQTHPLKSFDISSTFDGWQQSAEHEVLESNNAVKYLLAVVLRSSKVTADTLCRSSLTKESEKLFISIRHKENRQGAT